MKTIKYKIKTFPLEIYEATVDYEAPPGQDGTFKKGTKFIIIDKYEPY